MKYNVVTNGKVVKKNLSKKQAEDYCEKMNKEFMDSQEKVQKQKVKSGLPLRKSKYELYKVEVVKENVVRLTEKELTNIIKKVISEQVDDDSFVDDTESVSNEIMDILTPVYYKYGTEGVVKVLNDIIGTIEDIGDESFMGPEDY
jgi:hypothetical protein